MTSKTQGRNWPEITFVCPVYVDEQKGKKGSHSAFPPLLSPLLSSLQQYMTSQCPDHEQLFDLIQKMLEYDPARRLSMDQAFKHPFFSCLRKASRK